MKYDCYFLIYYLVEEEIPIMCRYSIPNVTGWEAKLLEAFHFHKTTLIYLNSDIQAMRRIPRR